MSLSFDDIFLLHKLMKKKQGFTQRNIYEINNGIITNQTFYPSIFHNFLEYKIKQN